MPYCLLWVNVIGPAYDISEWNVHSETQRQTKKCWLRRRCSAHFCSPHLHKHLCLTRLTSAWHFHVICSIVFKVFRWSRTPLVWEHYNLWLIFWTNHMLCMKTLSSINRSYNHSHTHTSRWLTKWIKTRTNRRATDWSEEPMSGHNTFCSNKTQCDTWIWTKIDANSALTHV